jgi:hypothetical protein
MHEAHEINNIIALDKALLRALLELRSGYLAVIHHFSAISGTKGHANNFLLSVVTVVYAG